MTVGAGWSGCNDALPCCASTDDGGGNGGGLGNDGLLIFGRFNFGNGAGGGGGGGGSCGIDGLGLGCLGCGGRAKFGLAPIGVGIALFNMCSGGCSVPLKSHSARIIAEYFRLLRALEKVARSSPRRIDVAFAR